MAHASAAAGVIDYYGLLNLPPSADLAGIENAYARISDELVELARLEDGHAVALKAVNEAYSVLSNPQLRRDYDRVFLAKQIDAQEREQRAFERRVLVRQRLLFGVMLLVVLAQAATLCYLARDPVMDVAHAVLGPLMPGAAK